MEWWNGCLRPIVVRRTLESTMGFRLSSIHAFFVAERALRFSSLFCRFFDWEVLAGHALGNRRIKNQRHPAASVVAESSALCREFGTVPLVRILPQAESPPVSFRIPTTFR
jgi:hypothetical protein